MIKFISSKAACILCKDEDPDEMRELYEYAIYILLSGLFHLFSVVALGLCFNMVLESLVFYCSFILIRKFAGGYHAKTPTRCYIFSVITSVVALWLIKLIGYSNSVYYYIFVIIETLCVVFILITSPLDNENKPLNAKEKKKYKILSIVMSLLLFVISLLLKWAEFDILSVAVSFGLIMCAVVVFLRRFQIFYHKHYSRKK